MVTYHIEPYVFHDNDDNNMTSNQQTETNHWLIYQHDRSQNIQTIRLICLNKQFENKSTYPTMYPSNKNLNLLDRYHEYNSNTKTNCNISKLYQKNLRTHKIVTVK